MYQGLSAAEAEKLLRQHGINEIPQKRAGIWSKVLKSLSSPISTMLVLAALLSFIAGKLFDANFILVLLAGNVAITLWQENKADNAIRQLNKSLAQMVKVFRDNAWGYIDSRLLLPGDLIRLGGGAVVPADGEITEAENLTVNESALTGESLPKDKAAGDSLYSGSFLDSGIAVLKITATGASTAFGKTVFGLDTARQQSLLERDVVTIAKFLTVLSLLAVAVLTGVFLLERAPVLELLTLDLSLIIAGIPVSLPTVMTLIIELGVLGLAKKGAVVRRLSALQDLANVNLLLTDKTGTLTENKITVESVAAYGGLSQEEVLSLAAIPAYLTGETSLDKAVLDKLTQLNLPLPRFEKISFTPFDSKRKRSTARVLRDGRQVVVSVGAPQVISTLCSFSAADRQEYDRQVTELAGQGFRALAVAVGEGGTEVGMRPAGLLALSDKLRADAGGVISFLKENGVEVVMVTGDNRAIASRVAAELSGKSLVVAKEELDRSGWEGLDRGYFSRVGAFAQVLPEDKLRLVQKARRFFVVAANGDGVNDLPAVKAADVGIAVKNAVGALKSAADIVLFSDGIATVKDALIESRKIFERVYSYSLYRISESFRLVITIAVLGILYKVYPLTPLQIILLALLNDIPIISLAFDRVQVANRPARINVKERFMLSSLYGLAGVANSLLLFFLAANIWHLNWSVVQTMFFLKLTVSGHLLIYVAHTRQRWFKFLPSREVIWATTLTQIVATTLALSGFLMPGRLSIEQVVFVWAWSFFWMQVSEGMKMLQQKTNRFFATKSSQRVTGVSP